jgi:2-hydroxy-3-oxopropionate reductase
VTVLPDVLDVLDVYTGVDRVLALAAPGTLLLKMSTIRPDVTRELHQRAAEASMAMLDAPVSGGEAGAREGTLSIRCGGTSETLERARPVLAAMDATIVLVGGPAAGRPSRRPTSCSSRAPSSWSPRPWSSWTRTGWTSNPRWTS